MSSFLARRVKDFNQKPQPGPKGRRLSWAGQPQLEPAACVFWQLGSPSWHDHVCAARVVPFQLHREPSRAGVPWGPRQGQPGDGGVRVCGSCRVLFFQGWFDTEDEERTDALLPPGTGSAHLKALCVLRGGHACVLMRVSWSCTGAGTGTRGLSRSLLPREWAPGISLPVPSLAVPMWRQRWVAVTGGEGCAPTSGPPCPHSPLGRSVLPSQVSAGVAGLAPRAAGLTGSCETQAVFSTSGKLSAFSPPSYDDLVFSVDGEIPCRQTRGWDAE